MRAGPLTLALAVATLVLGLVVLPADWSAVPTADPSVLTSPVQPWQWAVTGVGLALLSALAGLAGRPLVALPGVALPALAFWCYRAATAEVIGANLWVVGALALAVALVAGTLTAAGLGRAARRLAAR